MSKPKNTLSNLPSITAIEQGLLRTSGIKTPTALIQTVEKKGLALVSVETGIPPVRLKHLVNMSHLLRIRNLSTTYISLLMKAGIKSLGDLQTRNPGNLYNRLLTTNQMYNICKLMPSESWVREWVEEANKTKIMLESFSDPYYPSGK